MLDEDDVKVAADALKELEALMPSADRQGKQRNSDHRYGLRISFEGWILAVNIACLLCSYVQICNVGLLGQRRRGGAEAVAGTGDEGTGLALGLVQGLGIGTGENPDTAHGAGVGVLVGTGGIETSILRRAMRDGGTST